MCQLSDSEESTEDSDEEEDEDEDEDAEDDDNDTNTAALQQQLLQQLQMQQMQQQRGLGGGGLAGLDLICARRNPLGGGTAARKKAAISAKQLAALGLDSTAAKKKKVKKPKGKRGSKLEFKRVDQLWDSTIHNYKLTDTAEDVESSEYDQYLFNVRRTFDWEGQYKVGTCAAPAHESNSRTIANYKLENRY